MTAPPSPQGARSRWTPRLALLAALYFPVFVAADWLLGRLSASQAAQSLCPGYEAYCLSSYLHHHVIRHWATLLAGAAIFEALLIIGGLNAPRVSDTWIAKPMLALADFNIFGFNLTRLPIVLISGAYAGVATLLLSAAAYAIARAGAGEGARELVVASLHDPARLAAALSLTLLIGLTVLVAHAPLAARTVVWLRRA